MTNMHIRALTQKQREKSSLPYCQAKILSGKNKKTFIIIIIIIIGATREKYHYRRNVAFKRCTEIFESLNIDFWDIKLIFKLFFILKCIKIIFLKFYF
jgi:hypothetical protein